MREFSNAPGKKVLGDGDAVLKECAELETAIASLRAAYEQYFLGLERRPPADQHRRVRARVEDLRRTFVQKTAAKFRVNAVHNQLTTYERLWTRTLQEIEAGTYKRDLFKAKLHARNRQAQGTSRSSDEVTEPAAKTAQGGPPVGAEAPASAPPKKAPAAASSAPPPQAAPGQLSDTKLRAIYDAYVTAKRRCNEDVSRLSYDSLASTLRKQVPQLCKQHNATSVEFKVVIKDGKAVLRAVPK